MKCLNRYETGIYKKESRLFIMIMRIKLYIILFLFFSAGLYAESFRFALLTDLHIGGAETAVEDLKVSVNLINRDKVIDFVIVSGDITEEGDRKSLMVAKDELDRLNVEYYIIPGNHDTKWTESGGTFFSELFGSDRFEFEYKGFLFLGFNTGPLMRMADGHVLPEDIAWIKSRLEYAGKEQPVFIITHYPVKEGDVDNWYELTDAVRPYNIRAFIGGHYHTNREFRYDGMPGIICRSNLRAEEPLGGYTLFDVTGDSLFVYEQKANTERNLWLTLSIKEKYDKEEKDPRPDFSVNAAYPQVHTKWVKQTGVGIYASPVIYKKNVYVADGKGYLVCYDLHSGKEKWRFSSGNSIFGTPAIAEGILVFGSADHNIYALRAKDGKKIWQVSASEPVLGAVAIEKDVVYIGASDHTFRAIDIRSGTVLWTYSGVKGYIESRPLITPGRVIFGAWDNTLYALSKKDGSECWRWTGGLTRIHFSPAAVWPVAVGKNVFIVDPQRAMTAINEETGETFWRTYESKVRETIGLSEDQLRVYAKTMNDSIVCFSAQGDAPVKLWASDVRFGYEFAPSMLVERDGVVFGSTKNGLIFALDAYHGTVLWKHKVGNSLVNTVVPLSRKSLIYTAASGEVGILTDDN
jgi:outer membrane protein assembly factor BamB/calcineurin-like phosphoesterase family protein